MFNLMFGNLSHLIVPIVAILSVFGMPVAIVLIALHYRHQREAMQHETIARLLESGQPIPPELLRFGSDSNDAANDYARFPDGGGRGRPVGVADLRRGLVLTGIGAGVSLFLYLNDNHSWAAGLIPLCIGVAYLLTWAVGAGRESRRT